MKNHALAVIVSATVFAIPLAVSNVIAAEMCISSKECIVTPQGKEICKEVRKCIELIIPPFIT
jgi:hypothetical protein